MTENQIWQIFNGGIYGIGLDRANVHLMLVGIVMVIVVDVLNERGIYVSERISKERMWIRWPIYWGTIMLILLCGMWGSGFDANSFIYYQF